jgi:hypothetical protein
MIFKLIAGTGNPPVSKPYSASFTEWSETGIKVSGWEPSTWIGMIKMHK